MKQLTKMPKYHSFGCSVIIQYLTIRNPITLGTAFAKQWH